MQVQGEKRIRCRNCVLIICDVRLIRVLTTVCCIYSAFSLIAIVPLNLRVATLSMLQSPAKLVDTPPRAAPCAAR